MRLYRYWATREEGVVFPGQPTPQPVRMHGYSNESQEDADRTALRLLEELRSRVQGKGPEKWEYDTEKPIREEIVRELSPGSIVTRNRYGAEVLNTEELVFLDVDDFAPGMIAALLQSVGLQKRRTPQEHTFEHIRKAAAKYPEQLIRVYRTCAGYRLLVLHGSFAPGSPELARLMRDFRTDPVYAGLCNVQKCFRARLTPKPARIHLKSMKFEWPRPAEAEESCLRWLESYREAGKNHAVCRYLETLNGAPGKLGPAVEFHDEATGAYSKLTLA